MTNLVAMDEKSASRQFWLRTLLVIGMLWGFVPFVLAPFITKGATDTYFDIFVSVLNSLTVMPACVLAFWHRRIASIWLTVNGALLAVALAGYILRTRQTHLGMILGVAGPIAIALCLDVLEALRWPPALNPPKANTKQR